MAESLEVYRSSLFHQLLDNLVQDSRIGTSQLAKEQNDQVAFSGLYRVEQYVKELRKCLDEIPSLVLSANPGDVIAGLQIHQANTPSITTAPPATVELTGSYLHGTAIRPSHNIDLLLQIPSSILTEKDIQGYLYHDKRALYVAAVAFHLRHASALQFANLYITHEANDPLKPIIVINPSQGVDMDDEQITSSTQHTLKRTPGLCGRFQIILHFVPAVGFCPLRRLAPNRNNVKVIEQQQWNDISHSASAPTVSEVVTVPNTSPTPLYNQSIVADILATSSFYTQAGILSQAPVLADIIVAAKIWAKLKGLYIDAIPAKRSSAVAAQCATVNPAAAKQYQELLSSLPARSTTSQGKKSTTAISITDNETLRTLYTQCAVYYTYAHHHSAPVAGLSGSQITHIVVHLYLTKNILPANNIQHGIDAFFRFFPTHFYDASKRFVSSPSVAAPDLDGGKTLQVIQQGVADYKDAMASGQLTLPMFFSSFPLTLLDPTGLLNVLYGVSHETYTLFQHHALYALRLMYHDDTSFLSKDVKPSIICNDAVIGLLNGSLAPIPDKDIFHVLFQQQLSHVKQTASPIAYDFAQIHQLYQQYLAHETSLSSTSTALVVDGKPTPEYITLEPLENTDSPHLQWDTSIDVATPVSLWPFYPVLAVELESARRQAQESTSSLKSRGKKRTTTAVKAKASTTGSPLASYAEQVLYRSTMAVRTPQPLFICSKAAHYHPPVLVGGPQDLMNPILATQALSSQVATRLHLLLSRALNNRYYLIQIQPRITTGRFVYRINLQLNSREANRAIDRGPLADQTSRAKEFRQFWGSKAELRRFADNTISEAVVWSTFAHQLPAEVIPGQIAAYIIPLHLLPANRTTTATPTQTASPNHILGITPLSHPLCNFLQRKSNILEPVRPLTSSEPAQTISSVLIKGPSPIAQTPTARDRIVSNTLPISQKLFSSFQGLCTTLQDLRLPLPIQSVQPTSAVLRGTSPFPPMMNEIDPLKNNANHLYSRLGKHPGRSDSQQDPEDSSANESIPSLATSPFAKAAMFDPITVILNLTPSTKWPDDLMALNRTKTAFYLKMATLLFENHSIHSQVTPFYIDVFHQGFVFRCRINIPHEINLFRQSTRDNKPIPPLLLRDGCFREIEREYVLRGRHHELVKSICNFHPIATLTSQVVIRWLSAHHFLRVFPIELIELVVMSVFVNPAPYTVPSTLHTALLRVLHRLMTYDWENSPLLVSPIRFTGTGALDLSFRDAHTDTSSSLASKTLTYENIHYELDLSHDMLLDIYNVFNKRSRDKSRAHMCIVTPYDKDGLSWGTRPSTHMNYHDHVKLMNATPESMAMDDRAARPDAHNITNDDEEAYEHVEHQLRSLNEDQRVASLEYAMQVDRGDHVKNTMDRVPCPTFTHIASAISLSSATLNVLTSLLHKPSWRYGDYFSLFKPDLMKYDAFILVDPRAMTIDDITTALLLYPSKIPSDGKSPNANTRSYDGYHEFVSTNIDKSTYGEDDSDDDDDENDAASSKKKGKRKSKYKLPPDLVKQLKAQKEQEQLEKQQELQAIRQPVHAGLNPLALYVESLRQNFGQLASFSYDRYGGRVICVRFHPFAAIQKRSLDDASLAIRGSAYAHLTGVAPLSPIHTDDTTTKTLGHNHMDILHQMGQLGTGIVQCIYTSYEDFVNGVHY